MCASYATINMIKIRGRAQEYQKDGTFKEVQYEWEGQSNLGWKVWRLSESGNGTHDLVIELGPGYVLLSTIMCGMCTTDISRHHLPFSLPQVTGQH
jgi:hypothetical protein